MLAGDQLEKWAPDAPTWERAKSLSSPKKWKQLGAMQDLCWGIARTEGATRHMVLLRLSDAAFFCGCTVRKKPCKHVVALANMALQSPEGLPPNQSVPDWAEALIARLEHKPGDDAPADAGPSPEALEQRRRNREKRLEHMGLGLEELELWLSDRIRQGIGSLEGQAGEILERFAARMVDAKLGGIGRRVRSWKKLLEQTGWQDQLLAEMADLFLFVRAFRKEEQLPDDLLQDLLQLAGMNVKKEEVLQSPPLEGGWIVLGITSGEEDKLRFRRTWVQHIGDGRNALLLDFAWGNEPFEHDWKTGQYVEASLYFYPSAYPQRALAMEVKVKYGQDARPFGPESFEVLLVAYADALASQPWLLRFPAFLENAIPVKTADGWELLDSRQHAMPLSCTGEAGWTLLSLSGGHGIDLFGEWDGATFAPLSCLFAGRWIQLLPGG